MLKDKVKKVIVIPGSLFRLGFILASCFLLAVGILMFLQGLSEFQALVWETAGLWERWKPAFSMSAGILVGFTALVWYYRRYWLKK